MYERILVPVDGSEFAERVIPYARQLAEASGAALEVLCVAESQEKLGEAERYAAELAKRVGATAKAVPALGDVAAAIIMDASHGPETLVAATARGRGGIGTALLGSTARELVQASRSPVLVYRPESKKEAEKPAQIDTVILPVDGSARSESAERRAAEWAKTLDAGLVVVQVVRPDSSLDRALHQYDLADDSYVRSRAVEIKRVSGVEASWEVLHGDPVTSLSDYINAQPGALVVMATRAQSAARAAVLGSVTNGIMHRINAPVIVHSPISQR